MRAVMARASHRTQMKKDISKELRDCYQVYPWIILTQAADEIDRLRDGIEEYACTATDHPCGCYMLLTADKIEIERLRAENEKLKQDIKRIQIRTYDNNGN